MAAAKKKPIKWIRRNNKVIDRYLGEARAALAAAAAAHTDQDGDEAAVAALAMVSLALEMSPRSEAALELRARALLALRRYRDVADMLRDYIPSCVVSSGDDATSTSWSSSTSDRILSPERHRSDATRFQCCLDLFAVFCKRSSSNSANAQWRYLVLGQACFHLGLMEDTLVLLQTGRRLATAAFRRESVGWSEDSFVISPQWNTTKGTSVSQLVAHVKVLLRRRAAAVAALDAGLPGEAVRHFNKVLDTRRSSLPHPFATACLVGRAAAFRLAGRPADAIGDCNRALALDPAFIPALRARADLLESVGALPECLRDLDHLKLLYDAALRDGKLPGPTWRPQGGIRFGEIADALTARIHHLRGRVAAGEGCTSVDYYALLGVARGCTRAELERAHLLLTLKLKPERSVSFAERVELVDEHRDIEDVRDQARMSALFLYRMLHKGYAFIMSAVLDEEAAHRHAAAAAVELEEPKQHVDEAAAATATAGDVVVAKAAEQETTTLPPALLVPLIPMPAARIPMPATTAGTPAAMSSFCRDMAMVPGSLLSRAWLLECEAMSC